MIYSRPPKKNDPILPTNDDEEYEYFKPADDEDIIAQYLEWFEDWKARNLDLFIDQTKS